MDVLKRLRAVLTEEVKGSIEPVDYMIMFSTAAGQRVLAHLLYEHHVFEEIIDEEEMARRNVVVRMLGKAGIFKESNMPLLARALLEVGKLGAEGMSQLPDRPKKGDTK